ncbi:hypothetical protein J3459_022246, partial [Metarhizium acridum]
AFEAASQSSLPPPQPPPHHNQRLTTQHQLRDSFASGLRTSPPTQPPASREPCHRCRRLVSTSGMSLHATRRRGRQECTPHPLQGGATFRSTTTTTPPASISPSAASHRAQPDVGEPPLNNDDADDDDYAAFLAEAEANDRAFRSRWAQRERSVASSSGRWQSRRPAAGLQGHDAAGQRLLLGRVCVASSTSGHGSGPQKASASRTVVCAFARIHVAASSASQAEQDAGEAYF